MITTNSYAKESVAPSLDSVGSRMSLAGAKFKGEDGANNTVASKTSGDAPANLSAVLPASTMTSTDGFKYEAITQGGNQLLRVSDANGWAATFTRGAQTAVVRGPQRVFSEPSTTGARVQHNAWVRLLPSRFEGQVDEAWLKASVDSSTPDVLAVAMQYIAGASELRSAEGQVIAGDASYGPLQADGTRQEGSDFNDYLGIEWNYNGVIDNPEHAQFRSLDCSGYVRMIFGYRLGLPLSSSIDGSNRLPRRAVQMEQQSPGVVIVPHTGAAQSRISDLLPGDLTFYDVSADDGADIDHVGIYVGVDSGGNYRFISSRKAADGPTMGDIGGKSILNGSGMYAKGFSAARRI